MSLLQRFILTEIMALVKKSAVLIRCYAKMAAKMGVHT